jgi:glutathione S-transferase
MQAIKLYNFPRSGHAHRVELMLSLLQLPTELILVDLAKGEHKQAPYLAINSFGQVLAIDDDGVVLADSNAILVYLALKYGNGRWLPTDPLGAARVSVGRCRADCFRPAAARLVTVFGAQLNAEEAITRAHNLLKVMDVELGKTPILPAASRPSPTCPPTVISPMRRKATWRWTTTPTCVPGWRGLKPCPVLSACRARSLVCKRLPEVQP